MPCGSPAQFVECALRTTLQSPQVRPESGTGRAPPPLPCTSTALSKHGSLSDRRFPAFQRVLEAGEGGGVHSSGFAAPCPSPSHFSAGPPRARPCPARVFVVCAGSVSLFLRGGKGSWIFGVAVPGNVCGSVCRGGGGTRVRECVRPTSYGAAQCRGVAQFPGVWYGPAHPCAHPLVFAVVHRVSVEQGRSGGCAYCSGCHCPGGERRRYPTNRRVQGPCAPSPDRTWTWMCASVRRTRGGTRQRVQRGTAHGSPRVNGGLMAPGPARFSPRGPDKSAPMSK